VVGSAYSTHARGEICLKIAKATGKRTLGKPRHRWEDNMRNHESITILPADRGNAVVVLVTEDYCNKMEALLSYHIYKKVTTDSTSRMES
jgi:hypothetical protein